MFAKWIVVWTVNDQQAGVRLFRLFVVFFWYHRRRRLIRFGILNLKICEICLYFCVANFHPSSSGEFMNWITCETAVNFSVFFPLICLLLDAWLVWWQPDIPIDLRAFSRSSTRCPDHQRINLVEFIEKKITNSKSDAMKVGLHFFLHISLLH